jgi:glycosyltransferase involved in cell wall biosynthesis
LRVAVLGPTYPIRGGISHYTTLMVKAMREHHDVLFISYLKQYPEFLFPGRTQLDVSEEPIVTECERLVSFFNPASWRRAARRIVEFAPDVVVVSWVNPALAMQFRYITGFVKRRRPGVRIVFWCHNVVQHERFPMNAALTRLAFSRGDHFVVTCEDSKRNLNALRRRSEVTVAYLPSLDVFACDGPAGARERLGLDPDAPVVLFFGFVRAYKGLLDLVEAMPAALARVPELHLLVVGEFWEDREPYDEAVRRNGLGGKVTIVDRYVPNEEVAGYFDSADLVVLPYVTATGSGIVQMAYAFGKPVLTTLVGSLPEVVEDGTTGFLVEPGDPSAIAAAIAEFFESGRADEFAANIAAASDRVAWGGFVEAVESIAGAGGKARQTPERGR